MRAWQLHEIGEPIENLRVDEIDEIRPPDDGMVNVAIESVGIAFPDVLMCRGQYQIETTLPHIPGGESAGRVEAVGAGVADLREGERSLSQLWFEFHERRLASQEGHPIDEALRARVRAEFPVPPEIDFRMSPD